ncbi:hypothetical protein [Roseobacter weihaiensis]|uniref:hypothetical protein n=1 Tax=Roseobacter weihaiensis TaxID=2763262 RepID=UPI001D0B5F49|nr:hypothetical protein [Roseobacter sp. H9]
MNDKTNDAPSAPSGTIIRAENGDILRFDSTGMVMVLSDQVIDDIARRLPDPTPKDPQAYEWIDPGVLGDVDAWDLRRDGEWYVFNANLPGLQGPRQFRRLAEPDDAESEPGIIADGAGPLCGVFSLGGARRATGFDVPLDFPWHVLAPADDLGAVGHAGVETAKMQTALETLREMTRDAALADALVRRRHSAHKALPLFVARTETDTAASISELATGPAYDNLLTAIRSLKACAGRLGRPASLHALGLDYTLEDVRSDGTTYRNGVFDLIARLTADIARLGLRCPPILSIFDCGTHRINDHPVLRAQWELAWQGPEHGLHFTAPGYMFRQDRFGRPDKDALHQMAEMDACALTALQGAKDWTCPVFLLAETEPDRKKIRVRARALSDLVIDAADPFGAGDACGFSLRGATNDPQLLSVTIAEDDPQDAILTFDKPPKGEDLEILYAFGLSADRDEVDYPSACGALRDDWTHKSSTGSVLHRWALPAVLPVW